MVRAILSGATREIKEALKADGWTWDGKCWSKIITDAQADACRKAVGHEAQRDAARAVKANKRGCCLTIDGIARYTSPTYVLPSTINQGRPTDQDGFGWNSDAAGNRVDSRRIPGSSPDDRI